MLNNDCDQHQDSHFVKKKAKNCREFLACTLATFSTPAEKCVPVKNEGYFGVYGIAVSRVKYARYYGIEGKTWRYRGIEIFQRDIRYLTNLESDS